ncbi:hypothetical protein Clacol_006660 [Clathrus columnatus]|uniref:Methyltransferase type 11 domain-containing protein n=1 Tax=Clathrus columnatus TaxID=1419009 RepID=A0AAV5AI95_9AGAM|nr:hypothetical protein Clacol_006660 [Clathrus columnatus]
MPTSVTSTTVNSDAEAYEEEHVHAIYDQIASHFSSTRYKPWPIIAKFLDSLPSGSIGLDSGTGNGKYLPLPLDRPNSICTIGLDRSRNLLKFARQAGGKKRDVIWGDVLDLGWRTGIFDYAISIATIHHLASSSRRRQAVETLIRSVSPSHGRILIYVWAVEQDGLSKRSIPPEENSTGIGRDVFVPWILNQSPENEERSHNPSVFNRYYHMFVEGELENLVQDAVANLGMVVGSAKSSVERRGVEILQNGWERSNWYIELKRWQV